MNSMFGGDSPQSQADSGTGMRSLEDVLGPPQTQNNFVGGMSDSMLDVVAAPGGTPAESEEVIDSIVALFGDEDPAESKQIDVDNLLDYLSAPPPRSSGDSGGPNASSGHGSGSGGGGAASSSAAPLFGGIAGAAPLGDKLATDFPDPDPANPLPAKVYARSFIIAGRFSLKSEVDLKQIAFKLRPAEYNPRKHNSLTIRLFNPHTTSLVRASGTVTIIGQVSEAELRHSSKKVAKLISKCGFEKVAFANYSVTSILARANVGFPVRLDSLARDYWRNACYEPEICSNCVVRVRRPKKCTYIVTVSGRVMISGLTNMPDIQDALARIYPVLTQCQKYVRPVSPSRTSPSPGRSRGTVS